MSNDGETERVVNELATTTNKENEVSLENVEEGDLLMDFTLVDTHNFVDLMRNPNTMKKTASDVKKFSDWLRSKNEHRLLEDLSATDMDRYLALFFMTAQKISGEDYEPDTLKTVQGSINRYLKQHEKTKSMNIIEDKEFSHSREVLLPKRKLLRQKGKENKSEQAEPLTSEEMGLLYEKNLLGKGNARALVNTMYMNNTLHFGMRSREEHSKLRWGDIELKVTTAGEKYLEFTDRATKTEMGLLGEQGPILQRCMKIQEIQDVQYKCMNGM